MRLRFILGLILLCVALQFIAKALNGMLPILQEAAQYPASNQMLAAIRGKQPPQPTQLQKQPLPIKIVPPSAKFSQALAHLKKNKPKEKRTKTIKAAKPVVQAPEKPQNESAFMQITLEDIRPPVKNTALGPEASARLESFLRKKRADHAQLTQETGDLFGKEAQQAVIKVLTADERASLENARQAQSAADYAERQEKTDQKTSAALAAIFEKHKKDFNRRLSDNSPSWNNFFKKVNNFQKAAN